MIDLTVNDNPSRYQQEKPYHFGAGVYKSETNVLRDLLKLNRVASTAGGKNYFLKNMLVFLPFPLSPGTRELDGFF